MTIIGKAKAVHVRHGHRRTILGHPDVVPGLDADLLLDRPRPVGLTERIRNGHAKHDRLGLSGLEVDHLHGERHVESPFLPLAGGRDEDGVALAGSELEVQEHEELDHVTVAPDPIAELGLFVFVVLLVDEVVVAVDDVFEADAGACGGHDGVGGLESPGERVEEREWAEEPGGLRSVEERGEGVYVEAEEYKE